MLFNLIAWLLPDFPWLQPGSLPRYVRELLCGCFIKFGHHLPNRSVYYTVIRERLVSNYLFVFYSNLQERGKHSINAVFSGQCHITSACVAWSGSDAGTVHSLCLCPRMLMVVIPTDFQLGGSWSKWACFGKQCNWILFPN